jgi:hypothetical protein
MKSRHCPFSYLATPQQPCWGDDVFYEITEDGGEIYTCEGHTMCSLWLGTSDEENINRYQVEAKP